MGTYENFAAQILTAYKSGKTIKALLVTSGYIYDEAAHIHLSDINTTGTEITVGGYSRQTLTSVAVTYNADVGVFLTAADVNFGTFNQIGVLGPIFYFDSGTPSTSELICADVDGDPFNVTTAVSAVFRIDPDQGFLLARL